jgi:hypothetical protein
MTEEEFKKVYVLDMTANIEKIVALAWAEERNFAKQMAPLR